MNAHISNDKDTTVGTVAAMTAAAQEFAASAVADGLESASTYLREKNFSALAREVTKLVRTYPVPSLLIGVGLGYLLVRRSR